MVEKKFDYFKKDSQGTDLIPIPPEKFDKERYYDYEAALLERNEKFWKSDSGLAIYRRFRSPKVFMDACRDKKLSLALQLGGLQESIKYQADIANFLEPWYGIGIAASAFGADYVWKEGLAPAIKPHFNSIKEVLNIEPIPIEQTDIGKYILETIEYFLDKTDGKLPISPSDIQSAINASTFFIDNNALFTDYFENPEAVKKLYAIITDLTINFTKKQVDLIGDNLVLPGHGFASSRIFSGLGMSNDVITMISENHYQEFDVPFIERVGNNFGGAVFHSCGNWANKINAVKSISNLIEIDAAFSKETDPEPNPISPFVKSFSGTGITVNARIVGDAETIIGRVKKLWNPKMKLIVVTYCQTPEEQKKVYDEIHRIAESYA
jgi:uroporphyrinogen-III decarboxylase